MYTLVNNFKLLCLITLIPATQCYAAATTDNPTEAIRSIILSGHKGPVTSAEFSPNGRFIITASDDGTARIWNASNGSLVHILIGHTGAVTSAVFSPDGRFIITASDDHTARVWDTTDWSLIHVSIGHTHHIWPARFTSDSKFVNISSGTSSFDRTSQLWDTKSWSLVHRKIHAKWTMPREWDPKNRFRLYYFLSDSMIDEIYRSNWIITKKLDEDDLQEAGPAAYMKECWQEEYQATYTLVGHWDQVESAVFSPDGNFIVTAAKDNTARIWNANNGALIHTLSGHKGNVRSAVFSPDNRFIVTASNDKTARIWDDNRHVQAQAKKIALVLCRAQHSRLGAKSPLQRICGDQYLIHYIVSLAKIDSFEPIEQKSSCIIQ